MTQQAATLYNPLVHPHELGESPMTTQEELLQRLAQLEAENERLKAGARKGISMKVSEKGGLSVYGLGRFPITLYPEQWTRLLSMADDIRAFIEDNRDRLKWKDKEGDA
jgi:hypothetical protein